MVRTARRVSHGVCIWLTGLSGSGKTTTADELVDRIAVTGRPVTVLDGDVVRSHLSRGLGFSREDRDENVRRVAFVAAEIVRHGGLVICALVSPFRAAREDARAMVEATGGPGSFVEIFVDTPLSVVVKRDVKGLYAGAQRGEVPQMTGVADPYEPPLRPDLHLQTTGVSVTHNVDQIVAYLGVHGRL